MTEATDRWDAATADLTAPFAVVDLAAFDANAADLVGRAAGLPIRVASKSVRCRALLGRALAVPGFSGVMAYAAAEALWLVRQGIRDVFVAYPSVDAAAIADIAGDPSAAAEITLAVDSVDHVEFLTRVRAAVAAAAQLRVAVDVDASLRIGPAHLGVRRSPLRTAAEVTAVVRAAVDAGLAVDGLLFYDAQVAGLPDSGPHIRWVKRRSVADLEERRAEIVAAVRTLVPDLRFVNAGGTGSLHLFRSGGPVTELAAGSGLYAPTLFDGYDDFHPVPAMAFALPVVRRPGPGWLTAYSGGYVASGEPGWSRVPTPVDPGLTLARTEGTGEVQTPLHGAAADHYRIGDRVWMRGAKAGELLERFDEVHLIAGDRIVETVPSYRGEGHNFG